MRLFHRLFKKSNRAGNAIRSRARLNVESLEDRCLAAVDAFIWFELPGASTVQRSAETRELLSKLPAFEITDFSFGIENPTTIGAATGGAGAGKIKFNEFTIKKTVDRLDQSSDSFYGTGVYKSTDSGRTWSLAVNTWAGSVKPMGGAVAGVLYAAFHNTDPISGRITGIAADPSDPNTYYVGSANGGVWKTTDGGMSLQSTDAVTATMNYSAAGDQQTSGKRFLIFVYTPYGD
jgi:hypothetical protein